MWKKIRLKQLKPTGNSKPSQEELDKSLNDNVARIKEGLGNSSDLIVRFIKPSRHSCSLALIHIDGITNAQKINEHILEPLLQYKSEIASVG